MPKVVRKMPQKPRLEQPKKVAAYARVSTGKDAMLHSLSSQVSYYSSLIQNHAGWLYAGVYSDESLTGTKDSRSGFQNLLADCRAGKVNLILRPIHRGYHGKLMASYGFGYNFSTACCTLYEGRCRKIHL